MTRIKLFAIIGALSIASVSLAQENGDTKIIVRNEKTAAENYRDAASIFMDLDCEVIKKDDTFYTATFGPLPYNYQVKNLLHRRLIIATIRAKDGEIIVTSKNKASGGGKRETVYDPKAPAYTAAFDTLSSVVSPLGAVSYGR